MDLSLGVGEAATAGWKPGRVSVPSAGGNVPLVVSLWRGASAVGHAAALSLQFQAWSALRLQIFFASIRTSTLQCA